MINSEKINSVISELEKTSYEMKNIANISTAMERSCKAFDLAIQDLENYSNALETYDKKTAELDVHINELIIKLQDIRNDYHQVSSAIETVETDLRKFGSKIDLLTTELYKVKEQITAEIKNELTQKFERNELAMHIELQTVKKQSKLFGWLSLGIGVVALTLLIFLVVK